MRASPATTLFLAWIVPGGGHALTGQFQKAVVFLTVLTAMFAIGLQFGGELFAFTTAEPLVFLAAAAEWAVGGPRLLAAMFGAGRGDLVAVTYEYGNTFLIVAGLLNTLVALDALDVARGRKPA